MEILLLRSDRTEGKTAEPCKSSRPGLGSAPWLHSKFIPTSFKDAITKYSHSNLNTMRGGPNSGYVININAQTSQGQQAAVNAITNAASGMTPQTGSVNVNLSTSIGNSLSQLQVNRMVSNAIGIA